MLNPWIFGDEYLYISKARNIKLGIDVISDATLGHTYPPLYSYLIAPVISATADLTYGRIQLVNFFTSLLLLILSFFILNKVFKFTSSKNGWIFLIISYLLTTSLSFFTGYYFVALSENLYIPLIMLISSFFIYLTHQKDAKNHYLGWIAMAFLVAMAILTRSIGLTLIPGLMACTIWIEWQNKRNKNITQGLKKVLFTGGVALIFTLLVIGLFNYVEASFIQNKVQAEIQKPISSGPYLNTLLDFLHGKNNLFASFKILGNHLIYIFISSFFFPVLFYINEIVIAIKNKKLNKFSEEFIWLSCFGIFSLGMSYLHSYIGFQDNPIKYSTYFRYIDPTIMILWFYGLVRLWKLFTQKIKLDKLATKIFALLAIFLILVIPPRDFYITINSLGWGWMDLLKNNQWLIKPVLLLISLWSLISMKLNKKILVIFAVVLFIINLATLRLGYLDLHRWQAGIYKDSIDRVFEQLIKEDQIKNFYLNKDAVKEDSYLYYLKYKLLFENKEFIPMPIIDWEENKKELLKTKKPFAIVDSIGVVYDESNNTKNIEDKWQITIFN